MSDTENKAKLNVFFENEYGRMRSYVYSKIDNSADKDAEDIIQDVALKLFSRENSSPINNVAGFVYSAIRNRIIDAMRTKKPNSNFDDESEVRLVEFMEMFYGKADNSYSEEMKEELIRNIARLKPHYKQIIIAVDFEGWNYKELAKEMGIPEGTLMSRRHRALSILNKQLKQELKKEER
jgi:RNA polymerase sigma factor (sigma-70 family)|tara:strand:- start:14864 stop:15403 length:540 start_codon:yes stop_codon:yes gene_type:complete